MNTRPQAWLDQARNDLELAVLADTRDFHAQACFFASQAEKALKGAILELGAEPAHTHQLTELVMCLTSLGVPTEPLLQLRLKPLSRMATSTHYPDDDTPPLERFDHQDAEESIRCAQEVMRIVEQWDSPLST
jgi:HEPN domain-containing protein